jgi:hypothetical protein
MIVPLLFVGLAVAVWVFTKDDPATARVGPIAALMIVGWMPAAWLGVLVHEMGHYAAARRVGLRVLQIRVGPFHVSSNQDGLVFSAGGSDILGGMTLVSPTTTDHLRERYRRFVAGGPSASAYLAIIAVGATYRFGASSPELGLSLGMISFFAVIFLISSLLPTAGKGAASDSWWLLTLKEEDSDGDAFVAFLKILVLANQYDHPKTWPEDLVRQAMTATAPLDTLVHAHVFAAIYFDTLKRQEEALAAAEVARQHLGASLRPGTRYSAVRVCAAVLATNGGDLATARALLDDWAAHTPLDAYYRWTDACVMWVEGRRKEGLDRIREAAIELAPTYPFLELKERLVEGLEDLSMELRIAAEEGLGMREAVQVEASSAQDGQIAEGDEST